MNHFQTVQWTKDKRWGILSLCYHYDHNLVLIFSKNKFNDLKAPEKSEYINKQTKVITIFPLKKANN